MDDQQSQQVRLTIAQAWKDAQKFFEEQACRDGRKLADRTSRSLEDVIALLERRYASSPEDKDDRQLKEKAKTVCWNVLNGLKILAEYAEPLVSGLYQPAGICLQVTAFLLEIPGKVRDVFAGFSKLFETIQASLVQFKILGRIEKSTEVPQELVENTNKLMISFVRMCALCYKPIAGGRLAKTKVVLGAAFFKQDQGIKSELEAFRKLAEQQSGITGAVTLEHVLQTENLIDKGFQRTNTQLVSIDGTLRAAKEEISTVGSGMRSLILDRDQQKQSNWFKGILDDLAERLGPNIRDVSAEHMQTIQKVAQQRIPESGSWLYDPVLYSRGYTAAIDWLNMTPHASPVYAVAGAQSSGKTFLLSSILARLERTREVGSRLACAYYAFPRSDAKVSLQGRAIREDPVITAFKSLAFQIAAQNSAYAQELKETKSETKGSIVPNNCTYEQCWSSLRLSSAKIDLVCVIFIDDCDQIPNDKRTEFATLLLSQRSGAHLRQIHVRSILTGTVETFVDTKVDFYGVLMSLYNQPDISKFVAQELSDDNTMPNFTLFRKAHAEMLETFRNGPITDERDYSIIKSRIARVKQAIEDLRNDDEIQEIMDWPMGSEHEEVIKETVEGLNANLKSSDIHLLNEILIWIRYSSLPMSGRSLEEVLSVRGFSTENRYLRLKLVNRSYFAKLLISGDYDRGTVAIRSPGLEDFLKQLEDNGPPTTDTVSDEPRISLDIKITNATRATVRHFLWDLNKKIALDEDFFSKADVTTEPKETIRLRTLDAYSVILRQSLDLVVDTPQAGLRNVTKWAVNNLPGTLEKALRFENETGLSISNRHEIVIGLLSLLTDVHITIRNWQDSSNPHTHWLDERGAIAVVNSWLRGEDAVFNPMESLRSTDRRRLKLLVETSGRFRYFERLTVAVGREWLQGDAWEALKAFKWVNAYLSMLQREGSPGVEETNETPVTGNGSDDFAGGVPSKSSIQQEKAIHRFDCPSDKIPRDSTKAPDEKEDSLDLAPQKSENESTKQPETRIEREKNGTVPINRAVNLSETKDHEEAEWLTLENQVNRAVKWLEDKLGIGTLTSMNLRRIGETYTANGDHNNAINTYQEAFHLGVDMTRIRRSLALAYAANQQYTEATVEMEQVFCAYRESGDAAPKSAKELREDHAHCADWYGGDWSELKIRDGSADRLALALSHYREGLDLQNLDFNLCTRYYEAVWRSADESHMQELSTKILNSIDKETDSSGYLTGILLQSRGLRIMSYMNRSLLLLMSRLDTMRFFAGSIKMVIASLNADDEDALLDRIYYELFAALALLSMDDNPKVREDLAKQLASRSARLSYSNSAGSVLHISIANLSCRVFYDLIHINAAQEEHYVKQLESVVSQTSSVIRANGYTTFTYLSWYYVQSGRDMDARALMTNQIKDVFDLLTDTDPENNIYAFKSLTELLRLVGDDGNALTAWSVVVYRQVIDEADYQKPTDTIPTYGDYPIAFKCDWNDCKGELACSDRSFTCRCCPSIDLCTVCIESHRAGRIDVLVCDRAHDFWERPAYDLAYRDKIGKDNVEIGGKIMSGSWNRVGGKIVPRAEWLDQLAEQWGVKKQAGGSTVDGSV